MPMKFSDSDVGPPPRVFCVDVADADGGALTLLSQRPTASAHGFRFPRFRAATDGKLQLEFWNQLPQAAGIAVCLGDLGEPEIVLSLVKTIASSDARNECPLLARVPDLPGNITYGDFLRFYWAIRQLEKADVDVWVDGDIDRMQIRRRNLPALNWRTEYPPSVVFIERHLDDFLAKSLFHHRQYWEPMSVHINVSFKCTPST